MPEACRKCGKEFTARHAFDQVYYAPACNCPRETFSERWRRRQEELAREAIARRRAETIESLPAKYKAAAYAPDMTRLSPAIIKYVRDNDTRHILWMGDSYTGKTFEAYWLMCQLGDPEYILETVATIEAGLLGKLGKTWSIKPLKYVSRLIIDDVDKTTGSEWMINSLLDLYNFRIREGLWTGVTTNRNKADLMERLKEPLVNRLLDGSLVIVKTKKDAV
jgi:hypothetical protein